jgi:hypothetical protein
MARYKATVIFDVPENESHSKTLEKIYRIYDKLGINMTTTLRRGVHFNPLHDILADIKTRIVAETDNDIKVRTTTYEIVSWERLPSSP